VPNAAFHDQLEKQLYFAQMHSPRLLGVPVLWFPRCVCRTPTLDAGHRVSDPADQNKPRLLGLGVKVPYFIALSDHRDLTIQALCLAPDPHIGVAHRQGISARVR